MGVCRYPSLVVSLLASRWRAMERAQASPNQ